MVQREHVVMTERGTSLYTRAILIVGSCCILVYIVFLSQLAYVKDSFNLNADHDAWYNVGRSMRLMPTTNNTQNESLKDVTELHGVEPFTTVASSDSADYDVGCKERFNSTVQENVDVIRNYPRGVAGNYMWKLGERFNQPLKMETFPALVMAVDRHMYPLSQGLFKSFHDYLVNNPLYRGMKIIVIDVGLTRRQKKLMQSKCRCEIRKFAFKEFPSHIRNKNIQAWKPIVIQMILVEFGKVLWVDASVRFKSNTTGLADLIATSEQYGIVYRTDPTSKLVNHTHINLFKHLGEDMCKFQTFDMINTDRLVLFYTTESRAIVTAWVTCALNIDCIAPSPTGAKNTDVCNSDNCHKYEQSVFGILTRRLYHKQKTNMFNTVLDNVLYSDKTDDTATFFEQCKPNQCYL